MKLYLINYTLHPPGQNYRMIAVAIPDVAVRYAHVDSSLWYVQSWLSAEEIVQHLAIWFDSQDELRVHELGLDEASLNSSIEWQDGYLEHPLKAVLSSLQQPNLARELARLR